MSSELTDLALRLGALETALVQVLGQMNLLALTQGADELRRIDASDQVGEINTMAAEFLERAVASSAGIPFSNSGSR